MFIVCILLAGAWADVSLKAEVDRTTLGLQDELTLKLTVDATEEVEEPSFSAPDFQIVGSSSAVSMQQVYDGTSVRSSKVLEFTKMLRPKKMGTLMIDGIHLGSVHAPKILIQVTAQATPSNKAHVLFRLDVDKTHVYKGEEILASLYVLHRVQLLNLQFDQLSVPAGFVREDLALPYLTKSLTTERIIIQGEPWDRTLFARYALFPLQSGNIQIPVMNLQYAYQVQMDDDMDPFFGLLRQVRQKVASAATEAQTIHVQDVPEPSSRDGLFEGAIGNFVITTALSKNNVRAHDALSFKMTLQGKGNLSSVKVPTFRFPDGIELYASDQSPAKIDAQGVATKKFEFVLVPRREGDYVLGGGKVRYFDPHKKDYVVQELETFKLHVDPNAQHTVDVPVPTEPLPQQKIADLRPPEKNYRASAQKPFWPPVMAGVICLELLSVIAPVLFRRFRRQAPRVQAPVLSPETLVQYLEHVLMDYLKLSVRPVGLEAFRSIAEQKGMDKRLWQQYEMLMQEIDKARFAGGPADQEAFVEKARLFARALKES